jgi:hypothetical protein
LSQSPNANNADDLVRWTEIGQSRPRVAYGEHYGVVAAGAVFSADSMARHRALPPDTKNRSYALSVLDCSIHRGQLLDPVRKAPRQRSGRD